MEKIDEWKYDFKLSIFTLPMVNKDFRKLIFTIRSELSEVKDEWKKFSNNS